MTINRDTTPHQTWFKAAVLLGMAIYLTVLILTDSLDHYINVRFMWLSYLAAGIFYGLGLYSLLRLLRGEAVSSSDPLRVVRWPSLMVVSLPLWLALVIPSQPLGVEAVNGGVSTSAVGTGTAETFQRSPIDRNILDWLREFNRANAPASFNGDPVRIVGFVYREPTFTEHQFMIARFTVSCCVADAFAVGMPVEWEGASDLQDGDWIEISGTLQALSFDGELLPVIQPETVSPVEPPESPYIYS